MSVSRRASFAAGIAAVRRDRSRRGAASGGGGAGGGPAAADTHPIEPAAESTITVVAGLPTSPTSPQKDAAAAAMSAGGGAADGGGQDPVGGGLGAAMDLKTASAFVAVAKAATIASKKPRIQYEVRPFTQESLEKINIRTNNLIRDYGFLPKRSPNLVDGAQLPAKYEPFPIDLLGKPVEELDQYVYEKVRQTAFF